jgi:capsular polysaccharide biosynthesis protein
MAGATAVRLGDDRDPQALLGALAVEVDENVYEIRIKWRSTDPAEAVRVSEQWAHAFVDRRDTANLQLDPNDRIRSEIRDTTKPGIYSPKRRRIGFFAGVLGLLTGGLIVLLLEWLERAVVRNAREAEASSGLPVLAAVPGPGSPRRGAALGAGLRELGAALARWARLAAPVVTAALVGAAGAWLLSAARPEVWRVRTKIAVEPARGSDWGQTQAIREIMKGYSEDIRTYRVAEQVVARLELDRPPETLLAGDVLNVAPDEGVYEIHVDVRDRDLDDARAVSGAFADTFIEEHARQSLELDQRDRILLRTRDQAHELWAPKPLVNALAGAVLGGLVGAAAVYLLALVRSGMVHSPADATRAAGAPLLGAIPPAGRRRTPGDESP